MPKKSGRNLRESRIGKRLDACKIPSSEVIVKQFRSIHVNVKNAKRWFVLKKRLALVTDDELVAYLLDLAEPIIRRDGKCSRPGDWKTDQDKENDLEVVKIEEKDLNTEEPLRRSPRKQSIVGTVQSEPVIPESQEYARGQQRQKIPEAIEPEKRKSGHAEKRRSKIKHRRKTKEKHHREKRTRRKHSKNNNNEEEGEQEEEEEEEEEEEVEVRNSLSNGEGRGISPRVNVRVDDSDVLVNNEQQEVRSSPVAKTIDERLSLDEKAPIIVGPTNEEKKNSLLAENLNKNRRTVFDSGGEKILINDNIERLRECEKRGDERRSPECEDSSKVQNDFGVSEGRRNELESEGFETRFDTREEAVEEMSQVVTTSQKSEEENRRGKKKRKHSKHETSKKEEESLRPDATILMKNNEIVHKRRKKKHKRDSSSIAHRTKKFHDVRKAPQDGMVENRGIENVEKLVDAPNENLIDDDPMVETNVAKVPSENEASGDAISEPQRLAIKIKLCQDCNDRHIKDSCPLISTDIHFKDRISYQSWLNKHSENPEVTKALNSQDPISEGYPVNSDENYESDEESSPNTEQAKNKTKIESEDKLLHVNDDRPLYSRESLPDCFQLKLTIPEHGVGIFAFDSLPIYAKFGPLVGDPIKEMDIPDDFSMRHLWEVDDDGKTWYISTTNPLKSNWVRYVRPADTKEDRNVTVVTKNGQLYLVTTQNIAKGTELTYWADSQSSAWTRKNKIDKTNCGGCNLNFTHSIYYRLHCCIFHDTRYSLTIRKYHCKVCGAAVLGKDNIMKHAADLHGGRGAYQCQYCRKFFLRLNYLEMHRTYGCSQNPQRSRPLCDFCGRKFCQPQKLKVHIKRMHSDMSEVLREFQCKMCLKLLGSRAALQRHMKEVHHKDVVGAATCDRCGKMFQNKSNLKIHMLTHSGVKPFKCKESDCKAAFTTKQCLQFHYKKVHGLSEEMMPKIERSVAYTFDAYSGGLVEGGSDQQKPARSERRASQQQENSNSVMSLEDCSSEDSSKAEASMNSFPPTMSELESSVVSTPRYNLDRYILDREEQESELQERELQDCEMQQPPEGMRENIIEEGEMQEQDEIEEREVEEMKESSPSPIPAHPHQDLQVSGTESSLENERATGELDFYGTRLQSKGSKKWMGQLSNLNDAEMITQQQQHHNEATRSSDLYEFNETSMKKNEDRNQVVTSSLLNSAKLGLNIYRRPESTNASLLVEAALDAAERDIGAVTSPIIDENDRDTSIYGLSSQLDRQSEAHLDPYIQQQDELMSPASMSQENRKTPNSHVHIDYHIHRTVEYINNSGRTHSIEQYLPQDDLPRVASPSGAYNIHMQPQQDDMVSPSATPNQNRYQDINPHHHHQQQQQHHQQHHQHQHHHHHHHHHQVPSDNLSSDEGDSVAQNLSISVKEKSLQLDLSSSYKYEQLEPEFSRDRNNFEPLVLSNGELQGLDMSARGFHHSLGSQITNTRYHHHLYEITERQSVDLNRSNPGYSISPPPTAPPPAPPLPPPPPPPYPHSEVLRIVSLDLTPGHSVDLSLSRSHHLHSTGNRIISAGSPQPSGSSHVVPDTVEGRLLSSSSPPPSITGYNANYPVSPAAYHPPRPGGYHHYSGYY